MKQQLINLSKAALLAATFAATGLLASCGNDDNEFGGRADGSIPLVLGKVTVGETTTVHTRAALAEGATGYTGIRKSTFKNDDKLTLTLSEGETATTTVTATMKDGKWELTPAEVFIKPGTTRITTTHEATAQTTGILPDNLAAEDYTLTERTVTFTMKHVNAMIDVTAATGVAVPIESVSVMTDNGVYTTAAEEDGEGKSHFRTIVPGTGKVTGITAVINGVSYVTALSGIVPAADKRYPVELSFKDKVLTATAGAGTGWTEGGKAFPKGYDRVIATPEDLAQFAYDVKLNLNGARTASVIQIADIDLGKLKNAVDPYTYTATADNWMPIGGEKNTVAFSGKYNGNGHTISNMKITIGSDAISNTYWGLFGYLRNATIAGIQLRNGSITSAGRGASRYMGFLCGYDLSSVISLCSVSGTISHEGSGYVGGLAGHITGSHVTRCSADVISSVTHPSATLLYAGGIAGNALTNCRIAACVSKGSINSTQMGYGVTHVYTDSHIIGCYSMVDIITKNGYAFGHADVVSAGIVSCYATGTCSTNDFSDTTVDVYTDCAYTGGKTTIDGVTNNVAPADIYATVTASDASLAGVKTTHWSKEDGYTMDVVTKTWKAKSIWKKNVGVAPTIDLSYEGE